MFFLNKSYLVYFHVNLEPNFTQKALFHRRVWRFRYVLLSNSLINPLSLTCPIANTSDLAMSTRFQARASASWSAADKFCPLSSAVSMAWSTSCSPFSPSRKIVRRFLCWAHTISSWRSRWAADSEHPNVVSTRARTWRRTSSASRLQWKPDISIEN